MDSDDLSGENVEVLSRIKQLKRLTIAFGLTNFKILRALPWIEDFEVKGDLT